jgi:hypothetical protein
MTDEDILRQRTREYMLPFAREVWKIPPGAYLSLKLPDAYVLSIPAECQPYVAITLAQLQCRPGDLRGHWGKKPINWKAPI